jgi:predicted RNA-binding protein with PUA-like domain
MSKNYWLMKSEPEIYSIDDLARDKKTYWEGVRNYQARNFMRDLMKPGDEIFFYHSNAEPPGIAGIARVAGASYPDPAQFNSKSEYYDPAAKKEKPVWYVVDIQFVKKFPKLLPLEKLKGVQGLEKMPLLQRGQRLSVQPVSGLEWEIVKKLAE